MIPVAVPRRAVERGAEPLRMGPPPAGPQIVSPCLGQGGEGGEGRVQEPGEPDALARAALAHAVHAVVPVAGADQRQAVAAQGQALVQRAGAMLEQGRGLI